MILLKILKYYLIISYLIVIYIYCWVMKNLVLIIYMFYLGTKKKIRKKK